MMDKLVKMNNEVTQMQEQIDSIKTNIKKCTMDVYNVEKYQMQLRTELQNLGIDLSFFAKPGQKIVPGFHQLPHETPKPAHVLKESENVGRVIQPSDIRMNPYVKLKRVQMVKVTSMQLTKVTEEVISSEPNPEQSIPQQTEPMDTTEQENPQFGDTEQLTQDFTDTIDPHAKDSDPPVLTAQQSDISVMNVVTPDLSVVKTIPPDIPNPNLTLWMPPSQVTTVQPIFPYGNPAQQDISSLSSVSSASNVQAGAVATPQTPQQVAQLIVNPQARSTRWGRVLKGQHNFVCMRCQRPFTTKSDTIRHYELNCPMLPDSLKKKYKCGDCGQETFSSKQYLTEHIYEKHKKEFLYFCKACQKGFYKHSALNFHKKNCLVFLRSGHN